MIDQEIDRVIDQERERVNKKKNKRGRVREKGWREVRKSHKELKREGDILNYG